MPAKAGPQQPGKRVPRSAQAVKTIDLLRAVQAGAAFRPRVPAKWRWHHRVLLSLQSRLLRERGALLRASAEPVEPHSVYEADSATDEFNHELALAQLSAGQDALYEVSQAISKIHNGTYGVCEETGKLIPAARLRAIPWTRFTREVEERLETKGAVRRAGLDKAASVRGQGQIQLASEVERDGEKPSALANDETLARVFSPPVRRVPLEKIYKPAPKTAKRKGRNTPDT